MIGSSLVSAIEDVCEATHAVEIRIMCKRIHFPRNQWLVTTSFFPRHPAKDVYEEGLGPYEDEHGSKTAYSNLYEGEMK